MTSRAAELLPCPFCGGEPYVEIYSSSFPYEVRCKRCGCSSPRLRSQVSVTGVWNRRAAPPAPALDAGTVALKRLAYICDEHVDSMERGFEVDHLQSWVEMAEQIRALLNAAATKDKESQ